MNLYYWESIYLENYGKGTIVVSASTVEEAREKARLNFDIYDRDLNEFDYKPDFIDEDSKKDLADRKAKFETDISKEPELKECLFISGSE